MAKGAFQTLPGFRDFKPEDCAVRNYLFRTFREVARRYGFIEYETPIVEATELYLKKSGGELGTQLFRFEDQGGRDVTLRPEVTASLGRLLIASQRDYPKPLRWFEIGQCFRYEAPQAGRTREFYQFNVDLIGEADAAADAELIALTIELMRELGFKEGDFVIRLSDRRYWQNFAEGKGLDESQTAELLAIVDKLERDKDGASEAKLSKLGLTLEEVESAIKEPSDLSDDLNAVLADLEARGMRQDVEVDLSIVRGLAYYTGVVFEVFDAQKQKRAVAGGGRYDTLVSALSEGKVDLPAVGFAIGDVVIRNLIEDTPHAFEKMQASLAAESACDVFFILADPTRKADALALASQLRSAGLAVSYCLTDAKFNKQFKAAEQAGSPLALVIGNEFPEVSLKTLATREEVKLTADTSLAQTISQYLKK
ncbi:MAG: histidine--tRNA ligase [Akkermansiaceae bacterium]|jgi:histidyl-tRNA synthetase